MSFRFKGISSDTYFIVEKVKRSLLPPVKNTNIEIAGKPGAYHQKTDLGIRKHDFIIRMREDNIDDLNGTIRTVAGWLFSENPEELILEKEVDKYYLAQLDGDTDIEEIVTIGKGTLTFISVDPVAYDRVETMIPIASGSAASPITVGGTYETFPYVKATFNQSTTFFSYATDKENEQVVMGTALNHAVQAGVAPETLIMQETGANLTGWSASGVTVEDGIVAGTMTATGDRFTFTSLGTGTGWHGPAIKKSLPETLDNYRVDVWVKFSLADAKQMAKIELYLYNVNNEVIGKLNLYDAWSAYRDTFGIVRIGDKTGVHMINTHGVRPGLWNDFWGLLRIEKSGPVFKAYIGKVQLPGYIHHTRWSGSYIDNDGKYQDDLAAIGLHIAGYGTYPVPSANANIYLDAVNVYRKNQAGDNELEYIAEAGDVIEFDHYTKAVYKNGIPFKQRLNPFSNLFPLQPGDNAVGFQPNDIADIEISYRNRWL